MDLYLTGIVPPDVLEDLQKKKTVSLLQLKNGNFVEMLANQTTIPDQGKGKENMENGIHRTHRTAIFVDGGELSGNSSYANRVKRLGQSVNGTGIKADIYTVFADGVGGILPGIVETPPESKGYDPAALHTLASEHGYDLILLALSK